MKKNGNIVFVESSEIVWYSRNVLHVKKIFSDEKVRIKKGQGRQMKLLSDENVSENPEKYRIPVSDNSEKPKDQYEMKICDKDTVESSNEKSIKEGSIGSQMKIPGMGDNQVILDIEMDKKLFSTSRKRQHLRPTRERRLPGKFAYFIISFFVYCFC